MGTGTVTVRLPQALLQFWPGPASSNVFGTNLAEVVASLEAASAGLGSRLLDEQGRVRRHIAVFVNGEMVREREASAVTVRPVDRIQIVPSVSGG